MAKHEAKKNNNHGLVPRVKLKYSDMCSTIYLTKLHKQITEHNTAN